MGCAWASERREEKEKVVQQCRQCDVLATKWSICCLLLSRYFGAREHGYVWTSFRESDEMEQCNGRCLIETRVGER